MMSIRALLDRLYGNHYSEERAARINEVNVMRNRTVMAAARAEQAICASRAEKIMNEVAEIISGRRPNGVEH